jgi:hypothetical protein
MEGIDILKQRVDIVQKDLEVTKSSLGLEFEKISKAFSQMGNLLDLLYMEVSVLIEMLAKKEVINQDEFSKTLEETAKKVDEQIRKAQEDAAKDSNPDVKVEKA